MSISSDFMMMPLTSRTGSSKPQTTGVSSEDYQALLDAGWKIQDKNDMGLDVNDFLQLIVQQFQNQTIDETASTTDMINQMVQMSVIQALTTVTNSIGTMVDASTLTYAASLVGKEVTIGQYDDEGNLTEIVGTVTGTGTYKGLPVIFVNDKQYYLNEILAVGRVPEKPEAPEEPEGEEKPENKPDNGGAESKPL